jgi:hypothetical protein
MSNIGTIDEEARAAVWRAAAPDATDDEIAAVDAVLRAEPHQLRRMLAVYRVGAELARAERDKRMQLHATIDDALDGAHPEAWRALVAAISAAGLLDVDPPLPAAPAPVPTP